MFGEPKNSPDAVSLETAFTIRDDLRKPINDSVRSEMHAGQLYPYYGANGQVALMTTSWIVMQFVLLKIVAHTALESIHPTLFRENAGLIITLTS